MFRYLSILRCWDSILTLFGYFSICSFLNILWHFLCPKGTFLWTFSYFFIGTAPSDLLRCAYILCIILKKLNWSTCRPWKLPYANFQHKSLGSVLDPGSRSLDPCSGPRHGDPRSFVRPQSTCRPAIYCYNLVQRWITGMSRLKTPHYHACALRHKICPSLPFFTSVNFNMAEQANSTILIS